MEKKEKQKFAKTMTEEEIQKIEYERQIKNKTIDQKNEIAHKLASLSDQDYGLFLKQISSCERMMYSILNTKRKMLKNKVEITKGKTDQIFSSGPWQGKKKEIEDLEAENIINNDVVYEALENIRQILTNLYFNHVGNMRVGDKQIYLSNEDFNKYVNKISKELNKQNIGIFDERQKQILKD